MGDAGHRPSPPGSLFVGREWEQAQLRAALREAQAGRGQLLVVSGEAGIGKTRLAGRLAALAEGEQARVLWGRSWEGAEAPAFWPWIRIFRNMVFSLDPSALPGVVGQGHHDLVHLAPGLEGLLAPDAGGLPYPPSDQARFRLFDAATLFIRRVAAVRPLVLILEDLHEADCSSLLLLEFVARQLQDIPLLVLATCREPEADLNPAVRDTLGTIARSGHRIALARLRRDEVAEFLARGFDIFLTDETLSAVQEGTGGNPFFLDELARRFVAERQLREVPGSGLEIPEGLKGPIRSRLASLPGEDGALLALASVIGREFSFDLLVAASGLGRESVLAALGRLAALRLVAPAGFGLGPYRFAHALVRETIYQDLPAPERLHLHRRVGHAIERLHASDVDAHLDHLAHHFFQAAALGELERAIEYAQKAGERATRRFGYDEATGHYRAGARARAGRRAGNSKALRPGSCSRRRPVVGRAGLRGERDLPVRRLPGSPDEGSSSAGRGGAARGGGRLRGRLHAGLVLRPSQGPALGRGPRGAGRRGEPSGGAGGRAALLRPVLLAVRLFVPKGVVEPGLGGAGPAPGGRPDARLCSQRPAPGGVEPGQPRGAPGAGGRDRRARPGSRRLLPRADRARLAARRPAGGRRRAGGRPEIQAYEALARRVGYPHFVAYTFMFRAIQAMLRGEFADAEANALRSLEVGSGSGTRTFDSRTTFRWRC